MVVGREARAQLLCKIDRRTQTRAIAINPAADSVCRDNKALAQLGQRVELTVTDLDCVTFLNISPVDSRLRSVRVSIRCEIAPNRRRSCEWR